MPPESEDIDIQLAAAFLQIDMGQLSLHIGFVAMERNEQIDNLRHAIQYFTDALSELDQIAQPLRGSQEWNVWHEEARSGLHAATMQLAQIQK